MITLRNNLKKDLKHTVKICSYSLRNKASSTNDDYQYWQRSTVPTMHFQNSLPRLPIPKLEKTCERYLKALKPLLNEYTYSKAEKIVKQFQNEEGAALQKELIEQDKENKHTSYITEPWFDMYLSNRTPLPINYNPCLVYVNKGDAFYDKQLVKISNLIISSVRFYKSLKDNLLEPEVFHLNPKKSDTLFFRKFTGLLPSSISWYGAYLLNAYPLDMSQYSNLFNSTRIPKFGKDELLQDKSQKHIVCLRKGHFYSFDVLDENGDILSPELILSSINSILNDTTELTKHPVGVLTTTERNKWASSRQYLEEIGNKETLNKIDTALFAVALDNVVVQNPREIVRWFLHADGANRWFDKSFTLISTTNGVTGINFEHSWGDGVAVLRYCQDIYKDTIKNPRINDKTPIVSLDDVTTPKKLDFILDDKIKNDIECAMGSYHKTCSNLNVNDVISDVGKDLCKERKVSPDSIMQLAFQLAYFSLTKGTATTYESCSTAAFKHGRTETVRPCTMETKAFCEVVTSMLGNQKKEEIIKLTDECSKVHNNLVKNAAMGQGFDRHLFALRKLAEKKSKNLPELYSHSSYQLINHNILSTSTLSSDVILCGGFGPVVPDGYGIAYMIRNDSCGAIITNYSNRTNGTAFAESLHKSLATIKEILKIKKEN